MRPALAVSAWMSIATLACAGSPSPAGPRAAEQQSASLRDLAGKEWVLRSWDVSEAAPLDPKVTLAYKDDRFVGRSGCNQYFAGVTPGAEVGQVVVGPVGATRMACAQPVMVVESRFHEQLGKVTRFALRDGGLALVYTKADASEGTMQLEPAETATPR
jgi:heat shock protein HslJ